MRILAKTTNMSHDDWLKHRTAGLGGSDCASVLGLSPWRSPIDVWLDKMGKSKPLEDNEAMRQGRDLEEYVANRFCEATGKKVKRVNAILQHDTHDWLIGDVDRLIVGEKAGLECKTTNMMAWKSIKADGPPDYYELQCHHYMAVTGFDKWYLAVLVMGRDFLIYEIERDEELISAIITQEQKFWERHILTGEMPAPDGSESAGEAISTIYPTAEEGTELELVGHESALRRYWELATLIDTMEREQEQIKQDIKVEMKDAETAYAPSHKILWRNVARTTLDSKKLKEEKPDVWAKYAKESTSRRFEIKMLKED